MLKGTIRIWLDEFERLPEYSVTIPTGVCPGKTWRKREPYATETAETVWWIGQYVEVPSDLRVCAIRWFEVVLLQGPRRGNEPLRFKTRC
jgi:hypothetical protein